MDNLTLLTCSFNTPEMTITMLKSFVAMHYGWDLEKDKPKTNLLIMENSSDEQTMDLLGENGISDRCIIRTVNGLHSESVHKGLYLINTKYCLLVDTDIIFRRPIEGIMSTMEHKDITLAGQVEGDRGGALIKNRVHPWYCFINVNDIKAYNIKFHDDEKIIKTKSQGFYGHVPLAHLQPNKMYDVGSSFYEEVEQNKLNIADFNNIQNYYKHYEGMSWHHNTNLMLYERNAWVARQMYKEEIEKYRNVDIKGMLI
jgi:hypothetical protein